MHIRFYTLLLSLFVLLSQTGNSQNVGINSTGSAPGSSAMLDVSSTSKGMLIPRVSLLSTTDVATIPSPATSLLVYNSNAAMTNGSIGYWYYDGSTWVKFETSNRNWSTTGNNGTTASSASIGSAVNNNFIGTIDLKSFVMATNNLERMRIASSGNIGIATTSPTNILSFGGNSSRTIWLERHTTAASDGSNLTVQSGGAYNGGSNLDGGDFNLSSGTSTGTGNSNIYLKTSTAGSSGTADNNPSTKMTILGSGNVGINTTSPAQKLEISNGHVLLSNTNNTADELRFQEPSTSGSHYTSFKAPAQAGDINYTLPPSQSANTVLTNDGNGILSWATSGAYLYKRKPANESVTSSTALQDDNDFSFTLTANQVYEITALIRASCNSTGRLKSQFVAPTGTTILINIFDNTSGLDDLDWFTAPSTTTTVGSNGIDASTDAVILQGTIVVGGTGGTFKMQWAQNSSSSTATTLYANSYMKLVRVE